MATRRRLAVVAGVVVLLGAVLLLGIGIGDDDAPADRALTAGWSGSEGHPPCVYDARSRTVTAEVEVSGTAPSPASVTVKVTAYADENTSRSVGYGKVDVGRQTGP